MHHPLNWLLPLTSQHTPGLTLPGSGGEGGKVEEKRSRLKRGGEGGKRGGVGSREEKVVEE